MKLPAPFYARPTLEVARSLLGRVLVRPSGAGRLAGRIVETEAYIGQDDLACHASKGRTPRTEVMFGPPGRAYVYLVYGMYCCLNVVTEAEGFPGAVLIRAIEPLEGAFRMQGNRGRPLRAHEIASGPGKLCQALGIDRRLNAADLQGPEIWLEEGSTGSGVVLASPRIGVDYAESYRDKPWRFFLKDNPHVSRRRFDRS